MRKLIVLGSVALLGILLFVPALTSASPADLVATSGIPTKLEGNLEATTASGLVSLTGDDWSASLTAKSATVERVRITSTYARLQVVDVMGERRVDISTLDLSSGTFGLVPAAEDAVLAAEGRDARLHSVKSYATTPSKNFWSSANAQLSAHIGDATFGAPSPALRLAQLTAGEAPTLGVPAGTYTISAQGDASLARAPTILAYGASLTNARGDVLAESQRSIHEKPGGAYVPGGATGENWIGPGTHVEEIVEYFVVRGDATSLSAHGLPTVHAADLRIHHTGFLGFPWAEGTLKTQNETLGLSGDQVILGGDLRLRPIGFDAAQAPQLTLLGNGEVQYVQIGLEGRELAHAETAIVAGGAAAGIGLLALLVYFWPTLKYAASLLLFPLYARVPKENTLDHKGRELLYDLIKNEPGVSTNKLAREVPFGWSTLTYHLRVLERNEAIVSVRDGRYKRFFDRQSGRFANGRKYILAVLKNDATYDIASFIREKPGSSQKEVATNFQLSPSSVHWHVERLSEVGLVTKAREAHNVKYFPGEAWGHVTIEDLKALESAGPEPPQPEVAAPVAPPPSASSPPASAS